ncbi:LytR/AlgR family response regulator transcription factor [Wenyingzhuangia aestuarii]|uniref:LytR/AlgR family response regulator transcription factor n=1 Tax=Wenyingzhuangia aestuarii TaxID=1647582 RepID=UPI001439CAE4|nr:LytTR family DNA-binding domain-containing protein [Wenyingzhuangia aestuarii]NJB82215.1 two-component system LytT family response regulator [Wenyingzhuangia aestuarii]
MSKIKAIIVDDELSARENLLYLIENFCSEITVIATCCNVDEAVKSIERNKPDVVFLDIEMPQKNGFQLLKECTNINFKIVFITAYDQYAIKAFDVSALDYLLKPIDIDRLVETVAKIKHQQVITSFKDRIEAFTENKKKLSKISIPYKSDYVILNIEDILCIEADRMYSHIYTVDGKKYTASKKLNHYEELFFEISNLKRVHRSWIANLSKVESYSLSLKKIYLDTIEIPVSKTYKEEVDLFLGK